MTQMKIVTRDFGTVEVPSDRIITFPKGIFAFEDSKTFVLLSPLGDEIYPMWLQSSENAQPCFIVYEPTAIVKNYKPDIAETDLKTISYEKGDELELLVISVIPDDYKETTVNLKSPIVVNKTKCLAAQVVLEEDFEIKFPIFTKGEK
ncbi:MAG: flagellar assembly protein FliW [Oscillospiraceae bacterium]